MSNPSLEKKLSEQLADLKRDKQPARDLWSGIELAISKDDFVDKESVSYQVRRKFLLVASIAVLGVVGWLTISPQFVLLTGDELVASLSQQHQHQKQALLVSLQSQPALTENWKSQLTELDEAAEAIKKALKNDPNNMALLKMLQSVHQQQINLIERVHSPKWSQI